MTLDMNTTPPKPPRQRQTPPRHARLEPPAKDVIAALPPYRQLPLDRIRVVQSPADEAFALERMAEAGIVGFDTETKPVFQAGEASDGPHIIQLATMNDAFIFQVGGSTLPDVLLDCLESPHLLKVGFGLQSDRGSLSSKFGVQMQNVVDVALAFRSLGYRQMVGAKASVAIVLGERLRKSKKATTSNWKNRSLTAEQLQYAADDAQAALAVYLAMGCPTLEPAQPRVERVQRVQPVRTHPA